ncbi:sigma-70 family RNA polymerase sigma factor [Pedobacter sp. MC2016-14]|uniref:RNA polymerase sigma factor n=1 Tax=Pedobacter sp. MC2016-14 TaxID=2897327 RepID=UPI001E47F792|nr:sigma-70 family RNA polymerase sigma factor [Pedobacter sp. MC2016-14]MCD0488594.1 sigma-70 family RNA polymerase sigma factor [Pedobacter sp. MC2016-14]
MLVEPNYSTVWDNFRNGDEASFREIYDHFYNPLLNYGLKFSQNIEIAEDSLQDLFVKLWANRSTIKATESVKNYLYKSFRRVMISRLQAVSKLLQVELEEEQVNFDFQISHDQVLIEKEDLTAMQGIVQNALVSMTDRQREIIYLRFYEDLSYEQIADMMEITTKGAYKLVYRALDKMRENLDGMSMVTLLLLLKALKYS